MGLPNDLARLADFKSWLGVSGPDEDRLLESLITQTSRAILGYLDRASIIPTIYTEVIDGNNETAILLREWPVTSILSCVVDGVPISPSLRQGGSPGAGYILDVPHTSPPGCMQRVCLRGGVFSRGLQNITISYFAGYQITNETATVPIAAPYEITAMGPQGNFVSDTGVSDVNGATFSKTTAVPGRGEYSCLDNIYTFSNENAGAIVRLSYGYVPSDIGRACVEWAADQYQYRMRIGQVTKSLGGQESVSYIVKGMPDFVKTILQPYRRVATP